MQMVYKRNGSLVEYKLVTDPTEATVWTTHRLKKSEIKIMTKTDRTTAAQYREEILRDILSREPNPSKKSTSTTHEISERRKTPKPKHAKAGKTKQKTRRQSKR